MTHTEGKAEDLELIFLGRMSLAGQGYPQHFLLPLGYESLRALSLQTQILNNKTQRQTLLTEHFSGLPAQSSQLPDSLIKWKLAFVVLLIELISAPTTLW